MTNKNILFIVPDGVGIKNYLYSDVLTYLKQKSNIFIWSPLPIEAFAEVKNIHKIKLEYLKIILDIEPTLSRFLRETAIFARLKNNVKLTNNPTILTNWNYNPQSLKLFILNKLMQYTGTIIYKNYSLIGVLENWSKKFWSKKLISAYKKKLSQAKIDKIFITHQRVASLMPICIAAKELGIEVITVIYSWDNLPKARLNVMADKYLVWSDYMKEEMKLYYPEIAADKIIVTGTPQFEFYAKKENIISRADFAKEYQLDSSKKWICFSGDDELTSPYDSVYLNDLAVEVNKIEAPKRPQIIFRRCPVDFTDRYDQIIKNYNIIEIKPDWYVSNNGWASNFPKYKDVSLLMNIAYHSKIVFNIGSTMAFDFGTYNNPCGYINYNYEHFKNWSTNTIYKFQHFKSMDNQNSVFWINKKEDFIKYFLFEENNCYFDINNWKNKIISNSINTSEIISKIMKI